jgi:hypothetical protein
MDTDLHRTASLIGRNATLRIPHARGRTVLCASGRVWLTQHGDARDVFLDSGESFTLDHPGEAVVQAVGSTAAVLILDSDGASAADWGGPSAGLSAAIDRLAAALPRRPRWHDPAHADRISLEQVEREARQLRAATLRFLIDAAASALFRAWHDLHARLSSNLRGARA